MIPLFAGIAGLKSFRTLIPMIVASGIWYGTLTFVAATLLPKLEHVASFVIGLNWVGLAVVLLTAGAVVWTALRRKKLRRMAAPIGGRRGERG